MSHSPDTNDPVTRGHETSDAHFGSVLKTGGVLLGIMLLGMLISWGAYAFFGGQTERPGAATQTFVTPDPARIPPGPRLQASPHDTLMIMRHEEDSVLTSYGWVNRDSGIVRVPIDRAMEMLIEHGVPSRQ